MQDAISRLNDLCEAKAPRLGKLEKEVLAYISGRHAKGIVPLLQADSAGRGRRWENAWTSLLEKDVIHMRGHGGVWVGPDSAAGKATKARVLQGHGVVAGAPKIDPAMEKLGQKAIDDTSSAADAVEAMAKLIDDGVTRIRQTLAQAGKDANNSRKAIDMDKLDKVRKRGREAASAVEAAAARMARVGRLF